MLLTLSLVKLVAEIALMALAGQWVVGLMAGARRAGNPFYLLLETVGRPFVILARRLSPRIVLDRHVPLVAFLLLTLIWLGVTIGRIAYCVQIGVQVCR